MLPVSWAVKDALENNLERVKELSWTDQTSTSSKAEKEGRGEHKAREK